MPTNLLTTMSGQQTALDTQNGVTSYPSGGFSVRTSVGRVDQATVSCDLHTVEARATSIEDNNAVIVQAYNQDGTGEIADGTELADATFIVESKRL